MPVPINAGTRNIPLKFAKVLSERVNNEWETGKFISKVTPVTAELLQYWFKSPYTEMREFNFNKGQKQAILNTIYVHEVLKTQSVFDMYEEVAPELLGQMDFSILKQSKYDIPKYAIKMATGTGKTWVMHALLIWQYLNAKYVDSKSGRYSKHFLIIAPGLIVYNRLLDAYAGKEEVRAGERTFETSDFERFKKLFIPPSYEDIILGFIQGSLVKKDEIGSKVTGEGLIAITNWHLFLGGEKEETEENPLETPSQIVKDILPITPGKTAGHALSELDRQYFSGKEIEYLANLPDLCVFNDEAHHIHENKYYGEVEEVNWQKSLNTISSNKGKKFIQIDFSATPYTVSGSGRRRVHHFFPHIVVDFDLPTAIREGYVKTIVIDKRKEIATTTLDFKAIRDGRKVIGLSEGQKLMIRAGLKKLKILEEQFSKFDSSKHPKMFIMCEDTQVSPYVIKFLESEGLSSDDLMKIDSNKKGDVTEKEWGEIKQKLFNIDKYEKPKIIVSVLMLREGFDVNNICVIVPLRASSAPILLEQTVGRGLRLMWKGKEFESLKEENRKRLLVEKKPPENYLDILSIVEHPQFMDFYDNLTSEGLIGITEEDPTDRKGVLGDIIKVGLKENYQEFDMYWPLIVADKEETLRPLDFNINKLRPITGFTLEQLRKIIPKEGERFFSEELMVKTRFGEYKVTGNLFTAKSYNEFLMKMVNAVTSVISRVGKRKTKPFPIMQINNADLARLIDEYVRHRLFNTEFNPMEGNNWRVLLLYKEGITQHIAREISEVIYNLQNNVDVSEAKVEKKYFSEISELKMRENYSLPIAKTIYERLPYPSNKGEFEKNFMAYADGDYTVESLLKIVEYQHIFATIMYVRTDGLLAMYHPDFIIKTADKVYIVETKATKDLRDLNVKQKQIAVLDWMQKINTLKPEDRMNRKWEYALLGEATFYGLKNNGANIKEILEYALVTESKVKGTLF